LVATFDIEEQASKEHISINRQPFNKAENQIPNTAQDGEVLNVRYS
jgi:hypothetical protein